MSLHYSSQTPARPLEASQPFETEEAHVSLSDVGPVDAEPEDSELLHPEDGATTAEYGIVMLAAVGFAGLLVVILKSEEVRSLLMGIVQNALSTGS